MIIIKLSDQKASSGGKRLFGLHLQVIMYHWKKSELKFKEEISVQEILENTVF